jgi:EmrB/QacA subfamily drug resistance transporter
MSGVRRPISPPTDVPRFGHAPERSPAASLDTPEATAPSAAPVEAGARRYFVLALLASTLLVTGMQSTIMSIALPNIIEALNAPLAWAGWVFTGFTLGMIVSLPLAGRVTARFGAREIFLVGVAGFTTTSLLCAVAPDVWVLIAARVAQGATVGFISPSVYGIVGQQFPNDRAKWIGLIASLIPIAAILGLNVGGLIVDQVGWRWTFGFNVPLGILVIAVASSLLPRTLERTDQRFNLIDVALLATAAAALIFGLTELGQSGNARLIGAPVAFSLAIAITVLLVRRELRSADPIVDLDLLRRREFAFANALAFSFGACFLGMYSFLPLFIEREYGLSASSIAVLLTPRAFATMFVSGATALLLSRFGYRRPVVLGLWGMALTLVVFALARHEP